LIETIQGDLSGPLSIAKGPERSGRHLIGSGLVLLSRLPIEATHTVTYKDASRFLTHGLKADSFAAKGALHVRIRISSDPYVAVDCFLTHLESQSAAARDRQVDAFAKFIENHSTRENPVIVMGDFNVAADVETPITGSMATPYQQLCKRLRHNSHPLLDVASALPLLGTSDAVAPTGGQRIDYVFLSDVAFPGQARIEATAVRHLRMLDSQVAEGSLSDHMAVVCDAHLWWPETTLVRASQ
jgi:endonuclease/exonuclease/phosphatase family metal-dependent hydrolase